jgi:hypothetical protein
VWHALEPALKEQINAIRTRVREEREAKNATPGSDNTSSESKIPAQYPNMRGQPCGKGIDATKQVAAMVAMCGAFDDGMDLDADDDTDDEITEDV